MDQNVIPTPQGFDVHPTGEEATDLGNLRDCLAAAEPGQTLTLKCRRLGTQDLTSFDIGEKGLLKLTKPVRLVGEVVDRWMGAFGVKQGTTIEGGRQLVYWELDPQFENAPNPTTTIKDIQFKGFTAGAIKILASYGTNEILGCSFVDYRVGTIVGGGITGAFPIVGGTGKYEDPDDVSGSLHIVDCYFGAPPAVSNNLMHIQNCHLEPLEFSHNRIEGMHWVGIAVWGNKGHTILAHNTIHKHSDFFYGGAAISFGVRNEDYFNTKEWDGDATIEHNAIEVGAANSYGIVALLMDSSAYDEPDRVRKPDIRVRHNHVEMSNPAGQKPALACLGACSDSEWSHNEVSGSAPYGIVVSGDVPAPSSQVKGKPRGNTFTKNRLAGGKLPPFVATHAQAFVDAGAGGTRLEKNEFGRLAVLPPPQVVPRQAGISCSGRDGVIEGNDFADSGIGGRSSPAGSVCIHLTPDSQGNTVRWNAKDFPAGTGPFPDNQVLDEGADNDIAGKVEPAVEPEKEPVPHGGAPISKPTHQPV